MDDEPKPEVQLVDFALGVLIGILGTVLVQMLLL